MKISFTKMHGAANDFIVVDDRSCTFPVEDKDFLARMAARRTGVGCDGIILIQRSELEGVDLRMRFINPDGGEVEMCGNGARCFARKAYELGAAPASMRIETLAGIVSAEVLDREVRLDLGAATGLLLDVPLGLEWTCDFLNTGVPHLVAWVEEFELLHVDEWGRAIRHHERFYPKGTNVDFARIEPDGTLSVRTYERGVEGETLACGTGVAAVALIAAHRGWVSLPVAVHCAGGYDLLIDMQHGRAMLTGNAEKVFEGEIEYGNRV